MLHIGNVYGFTVCHACFRPADNRSYNRSFEYILSQKEHLAVAATTRMLPLWKHAAWTASVPPVSREITEITYSTEQTAAATGVVIEYFTVAPAESRDAQLASPFLNESILFSNRESYLARREYDYHRMRVNMVKSLWVKSAI